MYLTQGRFSPKVCQWWKDGVGVRTVTKYEASKQKLHNCDVKVVRSHVTADLTCMKVWQSSVKAPHVICLKHSHTSHKERALRISGWW